AHQEGVSELELALSPAGRPVACLLSLRPIAGPGQMPSGVIATLRPVEQVRQLVQRQLGATAALSLDDLVSRSAGMRQVVRQARIAARGAAPVLIRGEGGAGKNPLARAIHNEGQRADKPFLALDCRAIPHELMASELLGYERDASRQGRPSKFELAAGGTLLLDQIESLTLEMQAALLSALETGHFLRLGGQRPIALDARIMAATAADLERLVAEGSFIAHLYYRFGVFNLSLPPLRLRPEDIEELIERFLGRLAGQDGGACRVDAEAAGLLARYPWPGNVRELESALERAAAHCRDGLIRLVDLPERVRSGRPLGLGAPPPEPPLSVADAEREAIIRAGRAAGGRVGEMAGLLRIGRTTLWRKMKRLNLSPADFKG
ncbi:MAG: sigma-54 interaction domain-containing protein, partial [Candidatus Promineifilaceae bacterium]